MTRRKPGGRKVCNTRSYPQSKIIIKQIGVHPYIRSGGVLVNALIDGLLQNPGSLYQRMLHVCESRNPDDRFVTYLT